MKRIVFALFLIAMFLVINDSLAQCPMCKTAVESARDNGSNAANGLNSGILYLLALPYVVVSAFGILWFINKRKKTQHA